MHDVADKVGDAALVGAIAAAIAALALACRTRGSRLDKRPVGFPADANATLAKYENAYLQLVSKSAEEPRTGQGEPSTALEYALVAFEQAKGPSRGESSRGSAPPSQPPKAMKPGKGKR